MTKRIVAKSLKNISNFLDTLEGNNPDEVLTNSVEAVLIEWAGEFITECRNNLQRTKSVSTGNLADNITPTIESSNGVYTLSIVLPDYYDFVNKGVQGVKGGNPSPYRFRKLTVSYDMMRSIRKWVIRKNLKATVQNKKFPNKKVKTFDQTSNSMAYAVAVGIKKKGIKATHFFDKAIDKIYPQLAPKLAKALGEDVVAVIKNINVVR
jgi:hypothetical protein